MTPEVTAIELTINLSVDARESDYDRARDEIMLLAPQIEQMGGQIVDIVFDFASKCVSVTIVDPRGMFVPDVLDVF